MNCGILAACSIEYHFHWEEDMVKPSLNFLWQHLLKNNFYSLAGTDLHHEGHLHIWVAPYRCSIRQRGRLE